MQNKSLSGSYNIGPDESNCITTGELATIFCKYWGDNLHWKSIDNNGPRESKYLSLDSEKIRTQLCFSPCWDIENAISKTVEFTKNWQSGENVSNCMKSQINEYIDESPINFSVE